MPNNQLLVSELQKKKKKKKNYVRPSNEYCQLNKSTSQTGTHQQKGPVCNSELAIGTSQVKLSRTQKKSSSSASIEALA